MSENDTSGNQPKAEFRKVRLVASGNTVTTQANQTVVRTVSTKSLEGSISLRYTPKKQQESGEVNTNK